MSTEAIHEMAHALYDAEHTSRLTENPDDLPAYLERARKLISMLRTYRTKRARVAIAREIRR